jgi:hypothetical protein
MPFNSDSRVRHGAARFLGKELVREVLLLGEHGWARRPEHCLFNSLLCLPAKLSNQWNNASSVHTLCAPSRHIPIKESMFRRVAFHNGESPLQNLSHKANFFSVIWTGKDRMTAGCGKVVTRKELMNMWSQHCNG